LKKIEFKMQNLAWPQVQLALDFVSLREAIRIAKLATSDGIRWLEAGTPLIKSEGMNAVRVLHRTFPGRKVVADMKTLDAGGLETGMAFEAGASVVSISGLAHDTTVHDSVRSATRHGGLLMADLLMAPHPRQRAMELQALGVDIVCIHTGIDVQRALRTRLRVGKAIRDIAKSLRIPVAAAGGIDPGIAGELVAAGVKLLIVGSWITGSKDPGRAARLIIEKTGIS
jgi:3-hexulose-6-phosphate synthase/6-phospho-3-hexuloisomerase